MRDRYFDDHVRRLFEEHKLADVVAYCTAILPELRNARGERHPDIAHALENMAQAHYHLGDYRSSLEVTKEVVSIDCSPAGPVTAECVCGLSNLALDYQLIGRIEEAELAYERVLALIEKLPPGEVWDRAITLIGRAQVHGFKHEFEQAEKLFLDALKLRARSDGWCSPGLANVFQNLAGLYRQMGKSLAAERAVRKAIRIYRDSAATESVHYAGAIRLLARLLVQQSKVSEAKALANESLTILRRICAPGHPETAKAARIVDELAKSENDLPSA